MMSTLQPIKLSHNREIKLNSQNSTKIEIINRNTSPLHLPSSLQRSISDSSSVIFPSSTSKIIGKNEYILIVINHFSRENHMSYCGAGEEGVLYVLRIRGNSAESIFSTTAQSCLNNILLDSKQDDKLSDIAIDWLANSPAFTINWETYKNKGPITRTYIFHNGTFKINK